MTDLGLTGNEKDLMLWPIQGEKAGEKIPLVKSVSDTAVTTRTPEGRGLMPDYPVPLSYEEVMVSKEDIILNHTLQLISKSKYLGENPFSSIDKPGKQRKGFPWIPIGCGFLSYLIFFYGGGKR